MSSITIRFDKDGILNRLNIKVKSIQLRMAKDLRDEVVANMTEMIYSGKTASQEKKFRKTKKGKADVATRSYVQTGRLRASVSIGGAGQNPVAGASITGDGAPSEDELAPTTGPLVVGTRVHYAHFNEYGSRSTGAPRPAFLKAVIEILRRAHAGEYNK